MFAAAHVHHDRVHRVRALAFGVSQTAADVIETAKFGRGAENIFIVAELKIADMAMHTQFWIKLEGRPLVFVFHESVLGLYKDRSALIFNNARRRIHGLRGTS